MTMSALLWETHFQRALFCGSRARKQNINSTKKAGYSGGDKETLGEMNFSLE